MAYKVILDNFEGPFDLLVYLIENARMSIYDIRVAEITEQYMAYMEAMEQADAAVSSDFLVLAAELIDLKSKMLLPRLHTEGEDDFKEDPRRDLVERILEYKQFKAVSQMLAEREARFRYVLEKPREDILAYTASPKEELIADDAQFVRAFHRFLQRRKRLGEIRRRYESSERKRITAEARRAFILRLFQEKPGRHLSFEDLVEDKDDAYDVALSFSSLMEMIRERKLSAVQAVPFGTIDVTAGEEIRTEGEDDHDDHTRREVRA
ncbi:MAG: segregation/condensation protein A [Eubacteriales bacterium]|nr:segregation/condensation protein A [Eubacteriales bacterium]